MIGFIIFAVLAVLAIAASFVIPKHGTDYRGKPDPESRNPARPIARLVAAVLVIGAIVFGALASFYNQDEGTAVVERDFSGRVVGQSNDPGFHPKLPWVDTIDFSIRNQPVKFAGDGSSDNAGGKADGPQITVQDKDGVKSDIDIDARYSIDPKKVSDIYREYRDEETFKQSFILRDIRAAVRNVPGDMTTLDLLTKRGEVETAIREELEKRWEDTGVRVEGLSLGEIRPPASVVESYAAAQQAVIDVQKAQSALEKARIDSQVQVANAESGAEAAIAAAKGAAEANRLLDSSLTDKVLAQRLIEAYDEGTVFIVPEGSSPLVQVQQPAQ